MRTKSTDERYQPKFTEKGWQVVDGADGKVFPATFPSWSNANRDAGRRNRGNAAPFLPNQKRVASERGKGQ